MFRKFAPVTPWIIVALLVGVLVGTYAVPAGAVPGISSQRDPSPSWELYTASNSTNFARLSRAVYVKTAGDVALVDADGTAVVWPSVPAGAVLPVVAKRINATGSTNTGSGEFVILY